ncbi:hypothetical protein HAX54_016036, partial [Datura stramonium]|nr:hypothetical protein [Datura stramonium]
LQRTIRTEAIFPDSLCLTALLPIVEGKWIPYFPTTLLQQQLLSDLLPYHQDRQEHEPTSSARKDTTLASLPNSTPAPKLLVVPRGRHPPIIVSSTEQASHRSEERKGPPLKKKGGTRTVASGGIHVWHMPALTEIFGDDS